jgi:hypothetical protein
MTRKSDPDSAKVGMEELAQRTQNEFWPIRPEMPDTASSCKTPMFTPFCDILLCQVLSDSAVTRQIN